MYTLDQLAWFDRCLFPDDLQRGLRVADVEEALVYAVMSWRKRNPKASVVEIYQEFIIIPEVTKALDAMVKNFLDQPTHGR